MASPLALLFLSNNSHIVHHSQPGVPWVELRCLYQADRDYYRTLNDGYLYRSCGQVLR
ncbi:MAG: hypothetical protein GY945_01900 [Rhodobacteraceae bacterium]|nr:hypothetical protein [Paracoccaceae bacterium]